MMEIRPKSVCISKNLVASEGATYMEATLQWMDENSIDYAMLNKTVPRAILDKISDEAIKGNMLRPSVALEHSSSTTLDGFM
ncbi:late promoter transcription accessory protein [Klebsiella phage CPRSA]|nr:late promoter transcription accessory protein [Klebsiella phage CPRSA]